MKTPVGMLRNTKTDRLHPMPFRLALLPGGGEFESKNGVGRFRSIGHHTEGFATFQEALADIATHEDWKWMGIGWEWDGEESPATVQLFRFDDLKD